MHKNENTQNSHSFLALASFRGICIKFCVFLIPIMIFFKEKIFRVIIALFAYFKCKCEKNYTFSNIFFIFFKHFAKSKKLFFCQYLSFSVWFPLSLKHWSPQMYNRTFFCWQFGKNIYINFFKNSLEPCSFGIISSNVDQKITQSTTVH